MHGGLWVPGTLAGMLFAWAWYRRGYMDPHWVVPAALGILAGARLGPRLATRMSARALSVTFQVVLAVFGLLMLLKAVGVPV